MTNEQIQALKGAAERAHGEEWQYMRPSIFSAGYITNDKGETIVNVDDGDVPANRVGFIELANPAAILSLLAEREADKALIAEFIGHLRNAHAFIENTEAFGREAATGIISCGGAKWNIDASKAALVNSPREAHALTVKLPNPTCHMIWGYAGNPPDDFYDVVEVSDSADDKNVDGTDRFPVWAEWLIKEACDAAGITLVVGE